MEIQVDELSLIPGPLCVVGVTTSIIDHDMAMHSPDVVADALLSFSDARLTHPAKPSWWDWKAEWDLDGDIVTLSMTQFGDDAGSWGGSGVEGSVDLARFVARWRELLALLPGVWIHDASCNMYGPDAFVELHRSSHRDSGRGPRETE